jgi:mono/diheme cytochrome c family protein
MGPRGARADPPAGAEQPILIVVSTAVRLGLAAAVVLSAALGGAAEAAMSGPEIYAEACAGCHGRDGRGAPEGSGITVPLPDFTDCVVATGESTANWAGLIRYGGKFLGLSDEMPAFGDALTESEIDAVLAYVRGFCARPGYPLGDLNYPRPVFVEKAFPEDEAVLSLAYESARHGRTGSWETAIEKRIGPRGQVEASVPGAVDDPDDGPRVAGLGDLGLSYKYALVADPRWRSIVSARLALAVPTGNRRHGVGTGTPVVSPQLLSGHAVGPFVLQTAISAELPGDASRADRQMLYGVALQYRFGPYKKNVVAGVELEQTQAIDSSVRAGTVLGPTVYLPLSRRGHVAVGIGTQLPVAGARPYDWAIGSFLLWDFADGPFWAW